MTLPNAPLQYLAGVFSLWKAALEQADLDNHKKLRDIEVGKGCRLILVDTVTGTRYAATVASGAWVLTAL